MNETELLTARLREFDRLSYDRNILKSGSFLSLSEQTVFHRLQREFVNASACLEGGHREPDRAVPVFLPDYLTQEDAAPQIVAAVEAAPVNARFADDLTHRDFLGALMNLGMERSCIGDILVDREGRRCVIYCLTDMAGYIVENLTRVKHTTVTCRILEQAEADIEPQLEEQRCNVASTRLDALVAAVYNLSRQKAQDLIGAELVFLDGSAARSAGLTLKEGTRVSVRGYGKFIYDGEEAVTRKGRLFVRVRRFV